MQSRRGIQTLPGQVDATTTTEMTEMTETEIASSLPTAADEDKISNARARIANSKGKSFIVHINWFLLEAQANTC